MRRSRQLAVGAGALALLGTLATRTDAQMPSLPPGRLDSATVLNVLQMADFVSMDDRSRGLAIFDALWQRRADLPPSTVANIAASRATLSGDQEALVAAWRELARSRPTNEYRRGLMRVLLATGQYRESLDLATSYVPAPGEPKSPVVEDLEAQVAEMRGDWPAMRTAVTAASAYPGWPDTFTGYIRRLTAHAAPGATVNLDALLDSALAQLPRGFRIDPVVVYSDYGNRLAFHNRPAHAERAWRRALAVLDSLRPQAEARGATGRDSVRISRGRLMLALGRYVEATELLRAPSARLDPRERSRIAWLAVAHVQQGELEAARQLDRALAADTVSILRGATAVARAMIAEALGAPDRAATLLLASRRYVDMRGLTNNYLLARTLQQPSIRAWMRGR
jgi:tetratricopeptide (TPR) repeat protein